MLLHLLTAAIGTKLPIQNVRSPVANGGKADNICSLRDLPVLTHSSHRDAFAEREFMEYWAGIARITPV
jgi:hypothetical protein